jgi:hypothetical protein
MRFYGRRRGNADALEVVTSVSVTVATAGEILPYLSRSTQRGATDADVLWSSLPTSDGIAGVEEP